MLHTPNALVNWDPIKLPVNFAPGVCRSATGQGTIHTAELIEVSRCAAERGATSGGTVRQPSPKRTSKLVSGHTIEARGIGGRIE
jgi:hypothetical protein